MTKSRRAQKIRFLAGRVTEGNADFPTLGNIVWWSLRNIDINQEDFTRMLTDVGLPTKYAREHNYRSTFIRALKNMQEKRIIRTVEENGLRLVIQFTAETLVEDDDEKQLRYDPETILEIDKALYRTTGRFEACIVKGKQEIKEKVIEYFYREKKRYNSSDVTRYIQRILNDKADIVSLRENGSVYFIPAGYQEILDKAMKIVNSLPGSSRMEAFPLPDISNNRTMVGNAFKDELDSLLAKWQEEAALMETGDMTMTDKWSETRVARIQNVLDRIGRFTEVLSKSDKTRLEKDFASLEERIAPKRKLVLDA